ncbi:MAG: CoA-binding protein [Patescibacteria group bacterium]
MQNDTQLRAIFEETKVIASVGLSSNPARPSHGVCRYLQSKGYRIIPVNPNESEVLGRKSYPDLKSIPDKIDLVQIFRKPEFAAAIVEDAIAIGAKVVWMQDGAGNPDAAKRAEDAGLLAVVDDCMLRQHRRLFR